MFQIHYIVINDKCLAMLRVNANTAKHLPNARKLVTKMIHVTSHLNCGDSHAAYTRNVLYIKRNSTFHQSECLEISYCLKFVRFINRG